LALLLIKLVIVGMLVVDVNPMSGISEEDGLLVRFNLFLNGEGGKQAVAATGEGAGAPPAVKLELAPPDPADNVTDDKNAAGQNGILPGVGPVNRDAARQTKLPDAAVDGERPAAPGAVNATVGVDRESLARRQEDLARKEQELRVLQGELDHKLDQMRMLENRFATMMKDAEGAQDAKYRHLVDVLANMKPKQAASVLETLDAKIAVKVLAGMKGRQAGEILTFVRPETAAKLTESLARMQLPLQ
jgi:flagellar motility protein MotE (MotC chaperone)